MARAHVLSAASMVLGLCATVRAAGWADPQTPASGTPAPTREVPGQANGTTVAPGPKLHPAAAQPVTDAEIVATIQRGVDFLLKDQNGDGSWGSPGRTKDLNILAGIGSHHLDGDLAVSHFALFGEIDFAHPSLADLAQ